MSILLEALRKTEKTKKQQQVPTIHTEVPGRIAPEPLKTSPLLAMIAVALVVSGWFTWRQYQLPEVASQPPVSETAGQEHVPDSASRTQDPGLKSALVAVEDKPAPAPSNPPDQARSKPPRTPVESFQAPSGSPSSAGGGDAVAARDETTGERPVSSGDPAGAGRSVDRNVVDRASTTDAGLSPGATMKQKRSTAAPPEQSTAHIPEPIGYWELPDAIRAGVPEIRFTVLVYNQDPEQRFVLIDGQRLAEGASVQPGLLVKEIRRDGVIFSYRLYEFLVKR
jgi:general secretion pathway protein B